MVKRAQRTMAIASKAQVNLFLGWPNPGFSTILLKPCRVGQALVQTTPGHY